MFGLLGIWIQGIGLTKAKEKAKAKRPEDRPSR